MLGPDYGKLLRELALDAHTNLRLYAETSGVCASPAMLVGDAAARIHAGKGAVLILLAPGCMDGGRAKALLRDAKSVALLLPSIDEDGRVAFWQNSAAGLAGSRLHERTLEGVGLEVDWAWDSVIQECNANFPPKPNRT